MSTTEEQQQAQPEVTVEATSPSVPEDLPAEDNDSKKDDVTEKSEQSPPIENGAEDKVSVPEKEGGDADKELNKETAAQPKAGMKSKLLSSFKRKKQNKTTENAAAVPNAEESPEVKDAAPEKEVAEDTPVKKEKKSFKAIFSPQKKTKAAAAAAETNEAGVAQSDEVQEQAVEEVQQEGAPPAEASEEVDKTPKKTSEKKKKKFSNVFKRTAKAEATPEVAPEATPEVAPEAAPVVDEAAEAKNEVVEADNDAAAAEEKQAEVEAAVAEPIVAAAEEPTEGDAVKDTNKSVDSNVDTVVTATA